MGWKITFAVLAAVLAASALTGCGFAAEQASEKIIEGSTGADVEIDDDGESVSMETEDGSVNIAGGESAEVPSDFPSDMPLYDGTLNVSTAVDTADGKIYSLGIQTDDDAMDVASWYADELDAEGWTTLSEITNDSGGATMVVYALEKGTTEAQVVINADGSEPTQIAVTVTAPD